MGTFLCAQNIDINVCVIKLNDDQEHKAEYEELGSPWQAVTPSTCPNLSRCTACTRAHPAALTCPPSRTSRSTDPSPGHTSHSLSICGSPAQAIGTPGKPKARQT